jgi:GTP:adenosylcobinamide-phosphate guanylyltransferase
MYAIVTAGGIPKPKDALYAYTQGQSKALLDVAGKPMVQWVLDALGASQHIDGVVLIGLGPESGVTCARPLHYCANQGGMLSNILKGIAEVQALQPGPQHLLVVSSDIPGIQTHMVDWLVERVKETDDDLYYNVITQEVMEKRYPGSRRTFTKLKDMRVCGGDMNAIHTRAADSNLDFWRTIIEARKNPLKQASMIGWDLLLLLLLGRIGMEDAVHRVSARVHLKGRALQCPYAEVGMDVDKPHQLELMRLDMARQK